MFVYVIVNSENLKLYVGQHKYDDLGKYLSRKFWDANHHTSGKRSHLYASMRKYPRDAWSIWPLVSGITSKPELDECERLLIYALKTQHPDVGYNICDGGEGFTGRHNEATKSKISVKSKKWWAAMSDEERCAFSRRVGDTQRGVAKPEGFGEKIREALTGRTWTPEQREKIPAALLVSLNSDEVRLKLSQGSKAAWDRGCMSASVEKKRGVPRPPEIMAKLHSLEARAKAAPKIAAALAGRVRPDIAEKKKAWWAAHPDHKFSKERNEKIGNSRKGVVPVEALKRCHDPEVESKRQLTRFLKTVAWG